MDDKPKTALEALACAEDMIGGEVAQTVLAAELLGVSYEVFIEMLRKEAE